MAATKAVAWAVAMIGLSLGAPWTLAAGEVPPGPYPVCSVLPEEGLVAAWEFELWDARPNIPDWRFAWFGDRSFDCVNGLGALLGRGAGTDHFDPKHVAPFAPTPLTTGHYEFTPQGWPQFLTVSPSDLYRTPTFTWSAWVNITSFQTGLYLDHARVLSVDNGWDFETQRGPILRLTPDYPCTACLGLIHLEYACLDLTVHQAFSPHLVPTGAWHHIAGSFDGTRLRVFFDGLLVGEQDAAPCLIWDESPLYIGAHGRLLQDRLLDPQPLFGAVDGVRLYDLAVEPADLAASYEAQRAASGR